MHALMKSLFGIVRAMDEFGAVVVADLILFRRVEIDVVNPIAGCTRPTTGDPAQQMLFVDANLYRDRRRKTATLRGKRIQPFGLGKRSGKTIQDVSGRRVRLCEANRDHLVHQIVGYKLPLPHQVIGQHTQFSVIPAMLPEEVAGGNLRDAKAGDEELRLGALTAAGRP